MSERDGWPLTNQSGKSFADLKNETERKLELFERGRIASCEMSAIFKRFTPERRLGVSSAAYDRMERSPGLRRYMDRVIINRGARDV